MNNYNNFTISGTITRITPFSGGNGAFITVLNNQDYKKNEEWVKQAAFISVTAFNYPSFLSVGQRVLISGVINVIKDRNDTEGKRSMIVLNGQRFEVFNSASEDEEPAKETAKEPAKKKSVKKDASDNEYSSLWE